MKYLIVMMTLSLSQFSLAADAPKNTPETVAKGKAVYAVNCLTCHGDKGDGMGPAGKYMSPKPRNFTKDAFKKGEKDADIFASITKGLDGTSMTGFKTLPEADRWALTYYVQSFKAKK